MMNLNNMKNQGNMRGGLPAGALLGGKTNTAIKFLIVMIIGIIPLLLCSLFLTATDMASEFKQWGQQGSQATTEIDYGYMWLIGIGLYLITFPIIFLISGLSKEVNVDIIPATSAASLAMLNMFVIPHTSAYFLILSLPAFAFIGYIIGTFVMIIHTIKKLQRQMNALQQDPEVKKMMKDFENQMNGQAPTKGKKDYKDNPFVDIKEEDEE